jgi:hypothetical protein
MSQRYTGGSGQECGSNRNLETRIEHFLVTIEHFLVTVKLSRPLQDGANPNNHNNRNSSKTT